MGILGVSGILLQPFGGSLAGIFNASRSLLGYLLGDFWRPLGSSWGSLGVWVSSGLGVGGVVGTLGVRVSSGLWGWSVVGPPGVVVSSGLLGWGCRRYPVVRFLQIVHGIDSH